MVSAPLTSVNLLKNDIGEAAADIVRAAEQHGKIQTLCGTKPDQTEVKFVNMGLKAADAVLLAYDIKVNAPLKTLNLEMNDIGVEGAKVIAVVLAAFLPCWCVRLAACPYTRSQNGMRSAPSDARN